MVTNINIKCGNCGKRYVVTADIQVYGFREKEFWYCPHCKELAYSSMEYDNFRNEKEVKENG